MNIFLIGPLLLYFYTLNAASIDPTTPLFSPKSNPTLSEFPSTNPSSSCAAPHLQPQGSSLSFSTPTQRRPTDLTVTAENNEEWMYNLEQLERNRIRRLAAQQKNSQSKEKAQELHHTSLRTINQDSNNEPSSRRSSSRHSSELTQTIQTPEVVFSQEPIPPDNRTRLGRHIKITPHCAALCIIIGLQTTSMVLQAWEIRHCKGITSEDKT